MPISEIAAALGIFLLSSVKFLFAPGAAVAAGYNFLESVALTTGGGFAGIVFFYYAGGWAMEKIATLIQKLGNKPSAKKVFTRRNRIIVNVKLNFGLIGLAVITPALLSIPIGSVLAARFYHGNPYVIPIMLLSTLLWSIGLTAFSMMVKANLVGA
jgi:hypothetical protein